MGKANAYSIFVKDEFFRRQKAREPAIMANLFQELGPIWQSLPEHEKDKYKRRAASTNDKRSGQGILPKPMCDTPQQPQSDTPVVGDASAATARIQNIQLAPAKFSVERFHVDTQDNKPHVDFYTFTPDIKPKEEVDIKPDVKNIDITQGVKREWEIGGPSPEPGPSKALVPVPATIQDMASLPKSKRPKLGIPNAKNFHNGNLKEHTRYLQYDQFELRQKCVSIISGRNVIRTPLYTFSSNVMCKYLDRETDRYVAVPLEIGLYGYHFKQGRFKDPYNAIIDSGSPPTGCLNMSRDHASTHKITFSPSAEGYPKCARRDYTNIYREMLDYVEDGERTIMVGDMRELRQTQLCLEWLHSKAVKGDSGLAPVSTWTIVPIVDYLVATHDHVHYNILGAKKICVALHYYLQFKLGYSGLDYNTSIMCSYHANLRDQSKWCAQSCATRMIMCLEQFLEEINRKYRAAIKPNIVPKAKLTPKNMEEIKKREKERRELELQQEKLRRVLEEDRRKRKQAAVTRTQPLTAPLTAQATANSLPRSGNDSDSMLNENWRQPHHVIQKGVASPHEIPTVPDINRAPAQDEVRFVD